MAVEHRNFWDTFRAAENPARAAPPPKAVDVCVVGGGYSGLWTAYWLSVLDPGLEVAVIEADRVGSGAAGRNAGWLSMKLPGSPARLSAGPAGRAGLLALQRAGIAAVDEVAGLMAQHGIDIDAHRGGYLQVAQTPVELTRLRALLDDGRARGLTEQDLRFLEADELRERVKLSNPLGAVFSPHCARINPRKLVDGLTAVVEARGVRIHERSAALAIRPGVVTLADGEIRARSIVRATEGHTIGLGGNLVAMQAGLAATAPLLPEDWDRIGWSGRECMAGSGRLRFYAQRTADDRIVFGHGSLPYRFQPTIRPSAALPKDLAETYRAALERVFPGLRTGFTHIWSGSLGVTRDWTPAVTLDRDERIGFIGGFAGQGVAMTYLAGRSMAALLLDRAKDEALAYGWTGRVAAKWPPEPLRWIGGKLSATAYRVADAIEKDRSDGRPTWIGEVTDRIVRPS